MEKAGPFAEREVQSWRGQDDDLRGWGIFLGYGSGGAGQCLQPWEACSAADGLPGNPAMETSQAFGSACTISLTGFICCRVVFWEVLWTANELLGVLFTGLELFHGVMQSLPLSVSDSQFWEKSFKKKIIIKLEESCGSVLQCPCCLFFCVHRIDHLPPK